MQSRRIHSREFKLSVCRKIETCEQSKASACREHFLAPSILDRWCEQYRLQVEKAFTTNQPKEPDKDRRIE